MPLHFHYAPGAAYAAEARRLAELVVTTPWPRLFGVECAVLRFLGHDYAFGQGGYVPRGSRHGSQVDGFPAVASEFGDARRVLLDAAGDLAAHRWTLKAAPALRRRWYAATVEDLGAAVRGRATASTAPRALCAAALLFRAGGGSFADPAFRADRRIPLARKAA